MSHVSKVLANQSSDKKQYRLRRYDKPDESVAKAIQKPELVEKKLKKLKDTPLHQRVGLSLKDYNDSNIFKVGEKDFAQRFTNLGYDINWITRRERNIKTGQILPNNDFEWENEEWELKNPRNIVNTRISSLIREGAVRGKQNFMIDLGNSTVPKKLWKQLSRYNVNNPQKQISRLLVFNKGTLWKIILLKEKAR